MSQKQTLEEEKEDSLKQVESQASIHLHSNLAQDVKSRQTMRTVKTSHQQTRSERRNDMTNPLNP